MGQYLFPLTWMAFVHGLAVWREGSCLRHGHRHLAMMPRHVLSLSRVSMELPTFTSHENWEFGDHFWASKLGLGCHAEWEGGVQGNQQP